MVVRRALVPILMMVLVLGVPAPAQAQEVSPPAGLPDLPPPRALVAVPVPAEPRLPGAPEAPEAIATAWFAASSDEQRRDIVLDVLAALGLGVYTMEGTPILFGAEQGVDDPWLYDFEVALLATDPALARGLSVADLAMSLESILTDGSGSPFEAAALAELIASATSEALAEPEDPIGFPLRLARELELAASGRDLAAEVPLEEPLTSLAAVLIELDILMPFAAGDGAAVAASSEVYRPMAARRAQPSSWPRLSAAARPARMAQLCDRIGSWAGKKSWDIGKLGARVLKGSAIIASWTGPAQLIHARILGRVIEVRGGSSNTDIHYVHPDEGGITDATFWVQAWVNAELPAEVRGCGALSGLRLPKAGPLSGLTVEWSTGPLGDHGTIDCPPDSCLRTGADGLATLEFAAATEPDMPIRGPEQYDRALVTSRVNFLDDFMNDYGLLPLAGEWKFRDVRIGWHDRPSYKISGSVPSEPKGIKLSGKACSLEKPFTLETKGDILGTITFKPKGASGGTWSYKGKVFNAPFKVVGSGTYTINVSDDRSSGTLDYDFALTIKIPAVGDQSGTTPASLPISVAPPCAK
jgi:hypothetical protein